LAVNNNKGRVNKGKVDKGMVDKGMVNKGSALQDERSKQSIIVSHKLQTVGGIFGPLNESIFIYSNGSII